MTLELFMQATGFSYGNEDDVELRRDTSAFVIPTDAPEIAAFVKTNGLDMPELEMLEFGCKELAQYISQAKANIAKMDTSASEDNPLLFLEFQEADDHERGTIMNDLTATHAFSRLVAREGWYTWKERLIDGFSGSLIDTRDQLEKDANFIDQFLEQLNVFLPEARLHLKKLEAAKEERIQEKTSYDLQAMRSLDELNASVVAKRTELASLPSELLALKERFAALEVKNESMLREKRTIAQDIESATKTRDSLKLLSKQEVKHWSDSINLFSAVHSWKASGHKPLSFTFDDVVTVNFVPDSNGSLSGQVAVRLDEARARLNRKTPCFADRGRRSDMKELQEFFAQNVRAIATSCTIEMLPVVSTRGTLQARRR
ncbi:Spc7 kinetochore protein-domain-containing protein [Hyaloraphidium curvatum]|nr:Spc7 kinetochore protein-domain-containing protein [Hyaloraphidium curvatum]